MVPLKHDKPLVCDATCLDSLASLYCGMAISSAVAAEERKMAKYTSLDHDHSFTLVARDLEGL